MYRYKENSSITKQESCNNKETRVGDAISQLQEVFKIHLLGETSSAKHIPIGQETHQQKHAMSKHATWGKSNRNREIPNGAQQKKRAREETPNPSRSNQSKTGKSRRGNTTRRANRHRWKLADPDASVEIHIRGQLEDGLERNTYKNGRLGEGRKS